MTVGLKPEEFTIQTQIQSLPFHIVSQADQKLSLSEEPGVDPQNSQTCPPNPKNNKVVVKDRTRDTGQGCSSVHVSSLMPIDEIQGKDQSHI